MGQDDPAGSGFGTSTGMRGRRVSLDESDDEPVPSGAHRAGGYRRWLRTVSSGTAQDRPIGVRRTLVTVVGSGPDRLADARVVVRRWSGESPPRQARASVVVVEVA